MSHPLSNIKDHSKYHLRQGMLLISSLLGIIDSFSDSVKNSSRLLSSVTQLPLHDIDTSSICPPGSSSFLDVYCSVSLDIHDVTAMLKSQHRFVRLYIHDRNGTK
jgi:hypothetical protein